MPPVVLYGAWDLIRHRLHVASYVLLTYVQAQCSVGVCAGSFVPGSQLVIGTGCGIASLHVDRIIQWASDG